tara:strand:- start:411 stop:587 length:177 start_codon:yes stop_codon:yes gene_type:complete
MALVLCVTGQDTMAGVIGMTAGGIVKRWGSLLELILYSVNLPYFRMRPDVRQIFFRNL